MYNLSNIAGTLKYGQFHGSSRKKILISYAIFTLLTIIGMVGVIIAVSIEQSGGNSSMPTINFIFVVFGIVVGFLITPAIFLFLIIKNEKTRKEILLWIKDAVELDANCEMLLPDYTDAPINQIFSLPVRAKIRVKFKYNGKHYTKYSGYKNKNGNYINDFQAIWVKYADKSIKILYSQNYDEVIVLK